MCHRRKVAAMGGMSANIPIKNDTAANDRVNDKVRADKLREVTAGHDGTWVAHPGLIPVAMKVFDENMKGPNQVSKGAQREGQIQLMHAVPRSKGGCECHRQANR